MAAVPGLGLGVRAAGFLFVEAVEAATDTGDESLDVSDFPDLTELSSSLSSNRLIFGLTTSLSPSFSESSFCYTKNTYFD